MPTIEFTKEYTVQSVPPETHEMGKRMVVSTASAKHFTTRGVAKVVDDAEPEVKKSQPASSEASETGGSSQPAPASPKKTSKRRGRPPKQEAEEPSPSTTTTDSQD